MNYKNNTKLNSMTGEVVKKYLWNQVFNLNRVDSNPLSLIAAVDIPKPLHILSLPELYVKFNINDMFSIGLDVFMNLNLVEIEVLIKLAEEVAASKQKEMDDLLKEEKE